jgi:hypothetical protein
VKYLLLASLLTACNFGLVDIEDKTYTCYDLEMTVGADTVWVDSVKHRCGHKEVTSPLEKMLDPPKW